MSLEAGRLSTNNYSSNSKEAKENAIKSRRRNLIYLILNFLRDEGLFETADSLISEARLTNEYTVCDNIDLDIILQDFSNYYLIKFNKQPQICKRNKDVEKDMLKCLNNIETKKGKSKTQKEIKKDMNKNENDSKKHEEPFIITQLKDRGDDNNFSNSLCNIEIITEETKPFSKFLAEISTEHKDIAEAIYQTTKYKHSGIEWTDIKGLENAKTSLREAAIYPLMYPKIFQGLVSPWKGILLYGPPGSGKTLLAKALACEFNRTFFNVSASLILSKWRGESEKNIKVLFDLARHYSPSIIFIDEFEALASKRDNPTEHEASRRLKSEILIELDGLGKTTENVLFLATSNLPWEIDPAILRRLEKRIYIPLPEKESRMDMFQTFLESSQYALSSIDLKSLAEKTEGYSGSDIRIICKEAAMMSVRKYLSQTDKSGKSSPNNNINQSDLECSIAKIKPTAKFLWEKYKQWSHTLGAE